jgi:hypothetical protein
LEEHWVFVGAALFMAVFHLVEQRMALSWVSWSYQNGLRIFRRSIRLTSAGGATYDLRTLVEQDEDLKEYMVYIPMTNGWLEKQFKSSLLRGNLQVRRAFSELRFQTRLSLPSALSIAVVPFLVIWDSGEPVANPGSWVFFAVLWPAMFAFQYFRLRKRLLKVTRRLEALVGEECA